MNSEVLHSISNVIIDISQLNSNDVLVDVHNSKVISIENTVNQEFSEILMSNTLLSILKSTNELKRESGTNALCVTLGIINWEIKSKTVSTPVLLIPVVHHLDKVKNKVQLEFIHEEAFINPFIDQYLRSEFDLQIPELEINDDTPIALKAWLDSKTVPFSFKDAQLLGNFHHHRYQIVKDLEGLLKIDTIGDNVQTILGKEDVVNSFSYTLPPDHLFPADNDQLKVFEKINKENTVIQGPPGTGKSQVLANLIGKLLFQGSTALIVSEKRVALEVLQKKLAQFQLDDFTFITTSETVANDFILSLKKGWERLEKTTSKGTVNLRLSEQYAAQLQTQLDLLSQTELIGGVSFDEFVSLSKDLNLDKIEFLSATPTISEWKKDKTNVELIFASHLQKSLSYLPYDLLKNDFFEQFDSKLAEWKTVFDQLSNHFEIETILDLQTAMKTAAICQVIENECQKSYLSLLNPDSKDRKKFNQLKKKFSLLEVELQKLSTEKQNWKEEPSENEAIQLVEALNTSSFFGKRKTKKRLNQLLKSNFIDPQLALNNWIQLLQKQKDKLQLTFELNEIGIQHPETDLVIVESFLHRLDKKDWMIYSDLSSEKRKKLCDFHSDLNQFNAVLKTYFKLTDDEKISSVFMSISSNFEALIRLRSSILAISKSCYQLIGQTNDFDHYTKSVFKSNWVKFEGQYPSLSNFKAQQIHNKIEEIIRHQNEESQLFSVQILEKIHHTFQSYHVLLRTAATKLSPDQKILKQNLRKGKSILVKEFSKTRNHPSIRELLQTEAVLWINVLKPIWLSNPAQIARCFPLEKERFDFVVFDEASQIPLPHALGALHRGKRVVVAGDEQQMSPSSYFKAGTQETIDLLHQAGYYWKSAHLKHHYRSVHPQLIAFSNKHFYQNSLIAYPSGNATENPIHFIFCENGIFDNRQNEDEAKQVAELIEQKIKTSESIGIVAFSESQLHCIWEKLSPKTNQRLLDRIDEGTAFVKTLEHVQGEECDELIISLGYAKNSDGQFLMRFGPLNQKSGSKRLNVLLTRAKKAIHFVASVQSKDFKISDNEAVNLLRLFIQDLEQKQNEIQIEGSFLFPHNLQPDIKVKKGGAEAHFKSIYAHIKDANELVTLQRVLESREWKVDYP